MADKTKRSRTPWVMAGGKIGEMGHCTRCGRGLEIGLSQPLPIAVAAMNAFAKIHSSCKEGDYKEPTATSPQAWITGRDTGTSSCTIYAVMLNTPMRRYDVPHDPDDFGRCYRLLNLFPEWRTRLPEVALRFEEWQPFVQAWGKLTAMYERELDREDKTYPLYNFMKTLRRANA